MPQSDEKSLWDALNCTGPLNGRFVWGADACFSLENLGSRSSFDVPLAQFRERSVLIATRNQLTTALALIELDGVARRLVLCTPDLSSDYLPFVAATAEVDTVVSDQTEPPIDASSPGSFVRCDARLTPTHSERSGGLSTEWILLTSGTTGPPKMVVHTLASLTGAIRQKGRPTNQVVWSTFYDIRRYGGLQILLRALLDGRSMVLSSAEESTEDFLTRAALHGVTHISGTPSHWRRALMSPAARKIAPRYVRLSGEIADQAILDHLSGFYEGAGIVHAFATTEAGLAFEVDDRQAGFPASLVGNESGGVEMKIENGSLRIRSARNAKSYLGASESIADKSGFIDTRDMVELVGNRYYFAGRRDGIINVGGLKVHPEEVESVINSHPNVRMSLVKSRRNPITGAVVVADVVVKSEPSSSAGAADLKHEILDSCHRELASHKVPVTIRFVSTLDFAASGKLARV
jgi:acyl-coenzyme A synthetase/AMP-(fatty) acid ligase